MATQAQSVLNTKSEIVNRKLDKPAYKAPISPGLPILPQQPDMTKHQASRIEHQASRIGLFMASNPLDKCRISSTNSPFCAKQTQFRKQPKSTQTQSPQRLTKMKTLRQDQKANPNKPKQTQSKPKQTPSPKKPKIAPTSFMERAYARKPLSPEIRANPNKPKAKPIELEAERRSLRVSFMKSSSRGPIKPNLSPLRGSPSRNKLEAERRSLRVSFMKSPSRGPHKSASGRQAVDWWYKC